MPRRAAWLLALTWLGCAPEPSACPGAAPALEDCALGVYHADCGGDAEPVFACDELTGACRWFTGGCVASGHVVSDCPIEDRCCHTSADGPWAFEDGWMPDAGTYPAPATRVLTDIDVIGATPIDGTTSNLEVVLDPAVTAPPSVEVTCDGALGALASVCASPVHSVGPLVYPRRSDAFALEVRPSIYGGTLLVEVLDVGGALTARVFPGYQTDAEAPTFPATCETIDYAGEVTTGTLRIDRLEAGAHGELVVHAVEGGTVTVRF